MQYSLEILVPGQPYCNAAENIPSPYALLNRFVLFITLKAYGRNQNAYIQPPINAVSDSQAVVSAAFQTLV